LFKQVEGDDEEATTRGDILKTLRSMDWPAADFTLTDISERLNQIAERVKNGEPEEPDMAELRRFCTAPRATRPTPKAISSALKTIEDTPTKAGDSVLMLRRQPGNDHSKKLAFKVVELKKERTK
jgi:hypothetical protein